MSKRNTKWINKNYNMNDVQMWHNLQCIMDTIYYWQLKLFIVGSRSSYVKNKWMMLYLKRGQTKVHSYQPGPVLAENLHDT